MCDWALMTALIFLSFGLKHLNLKVHCTACQHKNSNMLPTKNHKHLYTDVIKIGGNRGKVKTKHDITWFAQKTNVDVEKYVSAGLPVKIWPQVFFN
jgi:hypothetical protein